MSVRLRLGVLFAFVLLLIGSGPAFSAPQTMEPLCPITAVPGFVAFTQATSNPLPYDALRNSCLPSLVPFTAYGPAFTGALAVAGVAAPAFMPGGDVFVEIAGPEGPTAIRELTPSGNLAWNIPLPPSGLPFSMAATRRAVAAQDGHFVVQQGCPVGRNPPPLALLATFTDQGTPGPAPTRRDLQVIMAPRIDPFHLSPARLGEWSTLSTAAAGPFGAVQVMAGPFNREDEVVVYDAAQHLRSVYHLSPLLPQAYSSQTQPPPVWLYRNANHAFALSPLFPGMALVWGGAVGTTPLSPWASTAPVPLRQPCPVAPGTPPLSGFGLFFGGKPIDAAHPLVVDRAQAGKPIALEVAALTSRGREWDGNPAPGPGAPYANLTLDDAGAGGMFHIVPAPAAMPGTLDWSGKWTVYYDNPTPGRYVLTATEWLEPSGGGSPMACLDVSQPSYVLAGAPIRVVATAMDAFGVPERIGPDTKVTLSRTDTSLVVWDPWQPMTAIGAGMYTAVVPTRAVLDGLADLGVLLQVSTPPGYTLQTANVTVITNVHPPTVLVASGARGGRVLRITPPADGDTPVGYAVYGPRGGMPLAFFPNLGGTTIVPVSQAWGAGVYRVTGLDSDLAQSAGASVSVPVRLP